MVVLDHRGDFSNQIDSVILSAVLRCLWSTTCHHLGCGHWGTIVSCHTQCHLQPHHDRAQQRTTTPGVPLGGTTTTPSVLCGGGTTTPGVLCGGDRSSPVWRQPRGSVSAEPSALAERAPPSAGLSPPRHPPPRALPRRVAGGGRRSGTAGFRAPIPSPKSFQPNGASEETLQSEIKELKQKDLALDQEIAQLLSEGYSLEELDKHISLLHEYNEIKDAGQMLLGKLAVIRGVTTKQLYPEYDLELSD
ncbi:DNA repair protein SWI5 homolog [Onychostruthus taczanowskii]|uniref:DNA repair protein SWI5 homolog n=1 Tax=Onychostruthus taczanowskii TaxID=356909 RepID=UPI001B8008AF|nr:DNA repair protein SWI5 homolog [Onychostruthus taczanowskii]